MCIAIISTSHPAYPFILISNRDEYLSRPTDAASFWPPPFDHVLSGRDLERSARGTWLGVTRHGRIACLTNFHEEDAKVVKDAQSRGVIINNWLKAERGEHETPEEWGRALVESGKLNGVGGFTLMYGKLQELGIWNVQEEDEAGHLAVDVERAARIRSGGLAILTNRTTAGSSLPYVASERNQTVAVSNAPFGDRSWPKVTAGEELLARAVTESIQAEEDKESLIRRLLTVLDTDAMPEYDRSEDWKTYTRKMRNSIFVRVLPLQRLTSAAPATSGIATPLRTESPLRNGEHDSVKLRNSSNNAGLYGTQKQTVILVDTSGQVTYFERTLFDQSVNPVPKGTGDRKFEFKIED